jgi:hypothetical protein
VPVGLQWNFYDVYVPYFVFSAQFSAPRSISLARIRII